MNIGLHCKDEIVIFLVLDKYLALRGRGKERFELITFAS
jgi:hypothetical protein